MHDHEDDQDIAETHPRLWAFMNDDGGLEFIESNVKAWGLGPIRLKDDLSPYVSGSPDLPPKDKVTHEVREMLLWGEHYDRVFWMIRTTQGRIIVAMQQRHEADPTRVGGEVELINAPFRDTAVKGLHEEILAFCALYEEAKKVTGL